MLMVLAMRLEVRGPEADAHDVGLQAGSQLIDAGHEAGLR